MKPAGVCVFDSIVAGTASADLVLDDDDVVAFLDNRPVFPGHTLVIPRQHLSTISEVPPDLMGRLVEAARRVAAAQREALGADGTFLALNDIVSQSVPHVHLHVVPRRGGDGLRGFFWPRTRYPNPEEATRTAAAIRSRLAPVTTWDDRS